MKKLSSVLFAVALSCLWINCDRSPVQYQSTNETSPNTDAHASYDWYGSMGSIAIYKTTTNDLIGNGSTNLVGNVKSFEVNDGWIGALLNTPNKDLIVKVGLNGAWVPLDYNVDAFRISNGFVGELKAGVLWVKPGLNGAWVNETSNVKDFRMYSTGAPDLVLVALMNDGSLLGKNGINGAWLYLKGNIKDFRIDQNMVVALDNSGVLWAKSGGLSGTWINETSGSITQIDITLYGEVLALFSNGTLLYKYGLSGAWRVVNTGVKDFEVVTEWTPNGCTPDNPFCFQTDICYLRNDNTVHLLAERLGVGVPGNDLTLFSNVKLYNLFGCTNNRQITVLQYDGKVWSWNLGLNTYWNISNLSSFMQW
jgi:hypothetical protein